MLSNSTGRYLLNTAFLSRRGHDCWWHQPTGVGEMAVNHRLPPENWPLPTSLLYVLPQAISHKWVPMWNCCPSPRTHPAKLSNPHWQERTRLWPSGADFWDKLWGIQGGILNHCLVHQELLVILDRVRTRFVLSDIDNLWPKRCFTAILCPKE